MQRVESDLGNRSYAATGSGRSILGEPEIVVAAAALAEELLITKKKTWLAGSYLFNWLFFVLKLGICWRMDSYHPAIKGYPESSISDWDFP